ncbi:hypothetical protein GCM10027515_00350 [Schumannella luteola]|uniref:Multicomponent Na+:H+ antiporter subunit E n=1 Tax=Schumannella luteola TaxID=472059 RepID=A0A852YNN7_9MICO|nr:Na+/H+ antiporter subunit E [Schumannella luteola]NYG98825.1 multicomponent Na+:H+ antiporter subunit E [Schumannella luteola]TPX01914.1 Na+/H+ antiporter subunit E [Schumannella luteola]
MAENPRRPDSRGSGAGSASVAASTSTGAVDRAVLATDADAGAIGSANGAAPRKRWILVQQLPLLVALVLLWIALWRDVSVLGLVTGAIVAVIVGRTFWLPPVELSGRFNPWRLLVLIGAVAGELVAASVQIARLALSRHGVRGNAVVEVNLRTSSDFVLTLTSIAVSLVPGSIVIEVDRARSKIFLHAIGVTDEAGVERVRRQALRMERRVVMAVGSKRDVERVCAVDASPATQPEGIVPEEIAPKSSSSDQEDSR